MTLSGASMEELFMLVHDRFSEANWVISLKALILIHILMHEGNGPMMYDYLIHRPNTLDMARFRDRHGTKGVSEFEQSKNVRTYAAYLSDKVLAYKAIRIDHVTQRQPAGSQIFIKQPTDIKFMLLEVSTVQKQLHSVLKNRFDSDTLDNEATFSAFRYCLRDMLKLFQVMNFGVMKMLKTYFDMDEDDMRRALDLYKRFVKLTDRTDEYLKIARQFENIFGFTIPNLNHAPLSLSKALDDFLNMPAEERKSTVAAMRQAPKPARPARTAAAAASDDPAGAAAVKMGPNGRPKPDYGLRLKPELLALSDDSPPQSSAAAATSRAAPAGDRQAQAAKPAPLTARTDTGDSVGDKPAVKEMDFIDFFSSIDDEAAATTPEPAGAPAGGAAGGFGGAGGGALGGTAQQNTASDIDAMFHALSNPFAALNTGALDAPAAATQQPQMQVVPASSSPFAALAGSGPPPHSSNGGAMLGSMAYAAQQQQQFNAFSGAVFDIGALQQQQSATSHQGHQFASVAANNPFRQSMFPTQPSPAAQQEQLLNQMAQLNMQQQQRPQQPQSTYNPFVQRQTMYLADANATTLSFAGSSAGPSGAGSQQQASEQFADFGVAFGGGANLQQHQQHQQQHAAGARNLQSAINNGNFANFDFFGK
ncbi:hypothetical protein H4R19_001441 [Coemansia spiralis]|nr:hypothetical protein H4R19_001441 [Coemansia spiralis]